MIHCMSRTNVWRRQIWICGFSWFLFKDIIRYKHVWIDIHGRSPDLQTIYHKFPSEWRHNRRNDVSNHQPHDCLLKRLFKAHINENSKVPRHWPLHGKFTGDRWIPHTCSAMQANIDRGHAEETGGWGGYKPEMCLPYGRIIARQADPNSAQVVSSTYPNKTTKISLRFEILS